MRRGRSRRFIRINIRGGDSLDWKELSVAEITNRVITRVQNGSICLFHNEAKNTPAALEIILSELKSQGYEFVPVSELIYKDNYTIDNDGKQILS